MREDVEPSVVHSIGLGVRPLTPGWHLWQEGFSPAGHQSRGWYSCWGVVMVMQWAHHLLQHPHQTHTAVAGQLVL
jgi:hypothetical protein